jgi:hypothetical protein
MAMIDLRSVTGVKIENTDVRSVKAAEIYIGQPVPSREDALGGR